MAMGYIRTFHDAGNMMWAVWIALEEGYNNRQVYDMYKDFAIYAQSQGDTVGRNDCS